MLENHFHLDIEQLREEEPRQIRQWKKLLVANRGEIAIRIIRAAHDLGLQTVAIYSWEDRFSMHRYKSDESYLIGEHGVFSPVGAYLAQDRIIQIAKERNVSAIHPGYGFLSENSEFARKVTEAGLTFVGPSSQVISRCGDKTSARELAIECGVPVVPGTDGPISKYEEAKQFVESVGFPVIIKAAMGGGGRGMRVVKNLTSLKDSFERAQSEAKAAFGDGTVFIERFIDRPKHIEVQILGDLDGNVIHLYERDCSLQRRHQKVVEMAPAVNLDSNVRQAILDDAVKLARHVGYRNAGTVEFLVDQSGRYYFIEINPRIQVEHTVTEELTGIDLVASQIQIASGVSLQQLGLKQSEVTPRGVSIQCRITAEDPANNFLPDTGRIQVYRSTGGNGVRLDGGSVFAGSFVTPYYDSLLVKLTCSGHTFEICRRKLIRSLIEFRVRGVKTNIPFLYRLLSHPSFISKECWTTFIDDTPELYQFYRGKNRAQKLLTYLADVAVNGSFIKGQRGEPGLRTSILLPKALRNGQPITTSCLSGWRNILLTDGPEAFAKAVRKHPGTLIMDTTWRDAHQSLLATRVRTIDMANIAPATSHILQNAFSLEMWGGATFDVALRFLYEDPWARLDTLRRLVPNVPFQMLLRGANAVGYTTYPDNVVYEFCKKAKDHGIDVFRIFDSLNYIENMRLGIEAVRAAGGVVEAAISYTGDVSDSSRTKYTLEYYLDLVGQLVDLGIHILGIKDMAGLLKPKAATLLIGSIREKFPDLPIHVHTHDTAGTGVASMIAAAQAGADVVDVAIDSMSGMTSQPSMGAVVAALDQTPLSTGIQFEDIHSLNQYWEQVRLLYSCFDPGVKSGDSGIYETEMPGGQYTNLLFQAQSLGLGKQWSQVKRAYKEANILCGDIVKVTPSSKVVGDFAQFMVSNGLSYKEVLEKASSLSFPKSVVEYFQGYLGQPYGGFPEPLRSNIIKNLPRIDGRPGSTLPPLDLDKLREDLYKRYGPRNIRDTDVISAALYPKVFADYMKFFEKYGDISHLPTHIFLSPLNPEEELHVDIETGKKLIVKLLTIGSLNPANGQRDVFFELNGESRIVPVADNSIAVEHHIRLKADPDHPGEIGAPMAGSIVELRVKVGGLVNDGDPICILNAMKMETVVSSPISGKVEYVAVKESDSLSAGDLIVRIVKSE